MIYKFEGHEVELFDSVHNLPILRAQRYNKYLMQASDVGNTLSDYDEKTQKAVEFLKKGMTAEAVQELENRRLCVYNALEGFTPQGKAFAVLVKRIDKQKYIDFSPDALDRCLEHLDKIGLSNATSIEKLKEVKKKIETELFVYYPKFFPKDGNKEITVLRTRRMNNLLDSVIEGEEKEKELFDIEKEILQHDKPNNWNIRKEDNMEKALEVNFMKFGIGVTKKIGGTLEGLSMFKFYAMVELISEEKPKR